MLVAENVIVLGIALISDSQKITDECVANLKLSGKSSTPSAVVDLDISPDHMWQISHILSVNSQSSVLWMTHTSYKVLESGIIAMKIEYFSVLTLFISDLIGVI